MLADGAGVEVDPLGDDTPVWLARFRPGSPTGRLWKDRKPVEW